MFCNKFHIFCILGAFYSFGMDSGSLLKDVVGPLEVNIRLSFDGWLSNEQSCHISFF